MTRIGPHAGKLLISVAATTPAVGAFLADWNETHVYNPKWPPHAKFHNAQTIMLAVDSAALALWQLWKPGRLNRSRLRSATVLGALFWVTQVPAVWFPGSALADPDNPVQPFTRLGVPINQVSITGAVLLPLLAAGYALEARRLDRSATA